MEGECLHRGFGASTRMVRACIQMTGRVVSSFIVQALLGRDITVYGEGLQTRSFCYVDDLIDGLIRLMDTPARITGSFTSVSDKEELLLLVSFAEANRCPESYG
jgi:nucleoside-diphosphate-sugar epimerase